MAVKQGDSYQTIEKYFSDSDGKKVCIHPLYRDKESKLDPGNFVNDYYKLSMDITLPMPDTAVDFSDCKQQRPFLEVCDEHLNLFLSHLRTRTRQFWIHRISFLQGLWGGFCYEIKYSDELGKVLHEEKGSHGGVFIAGMGLSRDAWDNIGRDIVYGRPPSVIDLFMEEARRAVFSRDKEALIINTAIALELFTKLFYDYYAEKGNKKEKYDEILKRTRKDGFVVMYFQKVIPCLTEYSLLRDDKPTYVSIDHLFRARNIVVHRHTGSIIYKDDGGTDICVDFNLAHDFFMKCILVMEHLRQIDREAAESLKDFKTVSQGNDRTLDE
jgi:hypothetical protein